jgi:hypothetical protein
MKIERLIESYNEVITALEHHHNEVIILKAKASGLRQALKRAGVVPGSQSYNEVITTLRRDDNELDDLVTGL